jgi:hypothetical protein
MRVSRSIEYGLAYLLGIVGGIGVVRGSQWGMYVVTVSYTTVLVVVVLSIWAIMLGIGRTEESAPE